MINHCILYSPTIAAKNMLYSLWSLPSGARIQKEDLDSEGRRVVSPKNVPDSPSCQPLHMTCFVTQKKLNSAVVRSAKRMEAGMKDSADHHKKIEL